MDDFIPLNMSITHIDPYMFDKWIDSNTLFKFIPISNQTVMANTNRNSKSKSYILSAETNKRWLKCLKSRNVSSILFIGDSENRYITNAIGDMLDKQNLLKQNSFIYFMTNNETGNIPFRYIRLNGIHKENKLGQNKANLTEQYHGSNNYLFRQLRWQSLSNTVILFNVGLWPLCDATDPLYFYEKYLPHYAYIFYYFLQIKYNATIIWRTIHWNHKKYSTNNITDMNEYNLIREKMNIFGTAMSNEFNWPIIDDYSYSFNRYDQIYDGIHYDSNSTVMNHTIMLFQRLSCHQRE